MSKHVNGSGTCPMCGREDTPLNIKGGFKWHYPRGGGRVCYGPGDAEERQSIEDQILERHRKGQRLLAHIESVNTRWGKVSSVLLNFARKGVPEERNSYNPLRYLAGEIGVWMDDRQSRKINERYPL